MLKYPGTVILWIIWAFKKKIWLGAKIDFWRNTSTNISHGFCLVLYFNLKRVWASKYVIGKDQGFEMCTLILFYVWCTL